jgi:GDPmannose 4,6-dehydratase
VKNYREAYNLFACNGILFNHESERRGHNFVTRKITIGLSKILRGETDKLVMGNINSLRDWGYAKDYVEGMWLMLQQDNPEDYILSTGEMRSVKEFIEKSFNYKGFSIKWKGKGVNEIGYDSISGRELIFIDPKYFRPTEVDELLGDYSKAYNMLGWKPKTSFEQLIKIMVDYDCK